MDWGGLLAGRLCGSAPAICYPRLQRVRVQILQHEYKGRRLCEAVMKPSGYQSPSAVPTGFRARGYILTVLALALAFDTMDRLALSLVLQDIKADLIL